MQNAKRNILIACPAYNGLISTSTVVSILGAIDEGRNCGWDVRFLPVIGTADIADTRNQILGLFWAMKDVSDLLFVDADIGFSMRNFTHIMSHDVDLVGGLYRHRTDKVVHYPVRWLPGGPKLAQHPITGDPLLEAEGIPAGFMRLTRKCLDMMCEADTTKWIAHPEKIDGRKYPFLFDWDWDSVETSDGIITQRLSEDYAFCRRFRNVGGQVWADPALKINHTGPKEFRGDFMAQVESENKQSQAA